MYHPQSHGIQAGCSRQIPARSPFRKSNPRERKSPFAKIDLPKRSQRPPERTFPTARGKTRSVQANPPSRQRTYPKVLHLQEKISPVRRQPKQRGRAFHPKSARHPPVPDCQTPRCYLARFANPCRPQAKWPTGKSRPVGEIRTMSKFDTTLPSNIYQNISLATKKERRALSMDNGLAETSPDFPPNAKAP